MSKSILQGEIPTTERLRELIEVEQTAYLWGQPHQVTPRLVDAVFGDGRRLLALIPLNTRPNWYVVRIDSAWALDEASGDSGLNVGEHYEEILEAVETDFGTTECKCQRIDKNGFWTHDEDNEECRYEDEFPCLSENSGCSWEPEPWPAEVTP